MGTVSVIPTRAALRKGFEESSMTLLQNYDPVLLVSSPQSVQELFIRDAVQLLLRDIDPSNPYLNVLHNAARTNLETMLQISAKCFEQDQSLASQEAIRRRWQAEIPVRIDSIQSIATFPRTKECHEEELVGKIAPLVTKRLLLERFTQAASHLRAADIRDFHDFPDITQHSYVENIVRIMTEGAALPEAKTIDLYQTLHKNFLEASDMVNRPPFNQATMLMSKEALKRKSEIGEWAAGFIIQETRAPKL